ncbi:MAG TPA: hypothetical protein VK837_06875 [Longimicrobiales bacterium]|nr:hypothetical protein [Longimicrobiales bacterium]
MLAFPRRLLFGAVVFVGVSVVLASCTPAGETEQRAAASDEDSPTIEGTYRLVSRALPDGTILTPPQVMGLLTYAQTHRSITVVGEDSAGKFFAMRGATYTLTPTEYSEDVLFRATNLSANASDRTQIDYGVPAQPVKAPVTVAGDRIEFRLPGEPAFAFAGATMIATQEGRFVDTWERVR